MRANGGQRSRSRIAQSAVPSRIRIDQRNTESTIEVQRSGLPESARYGSRHSTLHASSQGGVVRMRWRTQRRPGMIEPPGLVVTAMTAGVAKAGI